MKTFIVISMIIIILSINKLNNLLYTIAGNQKKGFERTWELIQQLQQKSKK